MFIGIDLGTSSVKAVLLNAEGNLCAEASTPLAIRRPHPLWSEQDPEAWWAATQASILALRNMAPADFRHARAIGLTGQMHGAVLLDKKGQVLRPAILWNDGRASTECVELECREPHLRAITGNLAMPGFTAPKLLWVAKHEEELFAALDKVLLPKDYIRLKMTGEAATDMSDAAGTLWLAVGKRCWSPELLDACDLSVENMPTLYEGPQETGRLTAEIASAWGLERLPVAAGGGDNACAAVGIGAVSEKDGFISCGTSGVYFLPTRQFLPQAEKAIHAFCHAIPDTWHLMAVTLSAASALDWVAGLFGSTAEALLGEAEAAGSAAEKGIFFLPYLSGERTPHNNPAITGLFSGLTHSTQRADLIRAVLEGVALSMADASEYMTKSAPEHRLSLVGGGSRSALWAQIYADALGRPVQRLAGGERGPAIGAARLAMAMWSKDLSVLQYAPAIRDIHQPAGPLRQYLAHYRSLFPASLPAGSW